MMRELRLILLPVLMLASSTWGAWGQATGTVEVGGVKWEYIETAAGSGECSVKLAEKGATSGEIAVPPTVQDGSNSYTVVGITNDAFSECEGITKLTIPSGVASIIYEAFDGAGGLQAIEVDKSNKLYSSADGVLFNKDGSDLLYCPEGKAGKYEVPASVKTIHKCAFINNANLTEVVLGPGVETIGESAFQWASALTTIEIPGNVSTVEAYAFYSCDALTKAVLHEGVKSIGESAFSSNVSLEEVVLPEGLQSIGESAFGFSKALSKVSIPASVTEIGTQAFSATAITSIEVPGGVKKLDATFSSCPMLKSVVISGGVEVLEGVFSGCELLETVQLPSSVKTIESYTFMGCKSLVSIIIPKSVSEIGAGVFDKCSSLCEVYWLASSECQVSSDPPAFSGIASPATLYVRKGAKAQMTDPAGWYKDFTIVEGFVVSFLDSDGATLLGEQMVKPDGKQKALKPADPIKAGFTFKEWRKQGATIAFDFDAEPVTDDVILEAVWEANGGATLLGQKTNSVDVFKWEDWIYFSFRENKVITDVAVPATDNRWDIGFHITDFKTNGGASTTSGGQGAAVETTLEELKDEMPLDGLAWVTDVTGVGISKQMGAAKDPNEPVNTSLSDKVLQLDLSTMPPSISPSNKVWLIRDAAGGVLAFRIVKCDWDMSAGITLPMQFEYVYLKNYYTLAFDTNGGRGTMDSKTVEVGAKVTLPKNVFTRDGYTFAGWSKTKDAAAAEYTDEQTDVELGGTRGSTVTLYAVWKALAADSYTLAFDSNGGKGTMDSKTVEVGAMVTLPKNVFTRDGYTFAGWSTKADAAAAEYTDEQADVELGGTRGSTVTLYAVWEANGTMPAAKILLSYDAAVVRVTIGGAAVDKGANVKVGDELVIAPVKGDMVFAELKVNGAAQAAAVDQATYTYKVQTGDAAVKVEATVKAMKGTAVESLLLAGARVVANPVGEVLTLEGMSAAERVEVYSLAGKSVARQQLRGEGRVTINAQGLAAGVYVVRIAARDGVKAIRIVKR